LVVDGTVENDSAQGGDVEVMGQSFFNPNRAEVDAAMRAKFALRKTAKRLRATAIGVSNETQIETKPEVPAEPETVEPANVLQERVPESASVARDENVDNGTVPTRQATNGRKTFQIWTISSEDFREDRFSAPHLRRGKIR
jgi:phage host-nuclease inhibitor protein Gam